MKSGLVVDYKGMSPQVMSDRVADIAARHLNVHTIMSADTMSYRQVYDKFADLVAIELDLWQKANSMDEAKCDHPVDGLEAVKQGSALMVLCSKCMCSCLTDQDVWVPFEESDGKR